MADYQDVSGLPANDAMAQLELQRRLKMAQQLQQEQMPQGQMVSGHYVNPSWTQSLANLTNKYIGSKTEENALKQYGDYTKAKESKLSQAFDAYLKGQNPTAITTTQDNFVAQPLQQGMNVPTSSFGTLDQVAQIAPKFGMNEPAPQNMQGETSINQPISSTSYIPKTRQEQIANLATFAKSSNNPDLLNKMVLGQAESLFKAPETNLGKVEIDKFTPASIAKFKETGNYNDLQQTGKASTKYTNIQTDAAGVPFGFNTETQKYERLSGDTTAKTQWGEPYLVGNEYVQRNPITGEIRKAYESADKQAFTKTTELRNDFNNLPQVKAWNVVEPSLISARVAANDKSGASDLNLIYALGKILDPNSAVKEGELELAGNTGSFGQKVAGLYKSVSTGGKLPPAVKQDLLRQIESRTYSQKQQYESAKSKYTDIAKKNKLDPNDLFIGTVVEPVNVSQTQENPNFAPEQNATHVFNPATGRIEVKK
jgi:hypothetical protein